MAPSPRQLAWRGRIETGIRIVEPGLNLVLALGDRISRAVDPEPDTWIPPSRVDPAGPQRHVGPGDAPEPA